MSVAITGNTYPVKDQIRALGGKWDSIEKVWKVPDAKAEQAKALVANQPAAVSGKCRKCGKPCNPQYQTCYDCRPAPARCKRCGRTPNNRGWPRIYKSGICSDCYRDDREEREMGY